MMVAPHVFDFTLHCKQNGKKQRSPYRACVPDFFEWSGDDKSFYPTMVEAAASVLAQKELEHNCRFLFDTFSFRAPFTAGNNLEHQAGWLGRNNDGVLFVDDIQCKYFESVLPQCNVVVAPTEACVTAWRLQGAQVKYHNPITPVDNDLTYIDNNDSDCVGICTGCVPTDADVFLGSIFDD